MAGIPQRSSVIGGALSFQDSAAMSSYDVSGTALGTYAYNVAVSATFQLVLSSAAVAADLVLSVSGVSGARWIMTDVSQPAPALGGFLGDADVTINPASDMASLYEMPSGTMTANRAVTAGVASSPVTNSVVQIIRRDLTANTLTVKDDTGTLLYVFTASPGSPQGISLYFNGTHYALLSFYYVAK